jgi:hypothetical protein
MYNVQHHKEVKTFLHHKHTHCEIIESEETNLENVLAEIEQKLLNE